MTPESLRELDAWRKENTTECTGIKIVLCRIEALDRIFGKIERDRIVKSLGKNFYKKLSEDEDYALNQKMIKNP